MLPHLFGRPVSPGPLPDRQAGGLLLPAPRLHRHAGVGRRASRPDQFDEDETRPTSRSRTPRAISRWRSSAWSSSTPGAPVRRRSSKPDRIVFDLDPGRGHRLARGGRGGGARPRRAGRPRAGRLRQDHPAARASTSWCRSTPRLDLEDRCTQATGAHRRRASRRPRRTPSPPSMGSDEPQAAASSSTSTAMPAARRRSRPIRCGRATTCRHRRHLTGTISRSIDAPEDLNYSSLPGLVDHIRRSLGRHRRLRTRICRRRRASERSRVARGGRAWRRGQAGRVI